MKNTVEEANNFANAGVPSGAAARQVKDGNVAEGIEALSSRFSILKQVGESGNTRLYLARENHSRSANPVLLKILRPDAIKDPTELVSFLLEARAAARLSHENIIKARGAEQIGSTHFYILEHKAGAETLREWLDRKGWLDINRAIRLAHDLADALKYAHESGILHLEIEPNKILLDADGGATLTGFGVDAKRQFEWAHRKRSSKCSFAYLSPEQLDRGVADQRSDLYSLGITLYEALTDRLPFNAENIEEMRRKVATQKAQPPHLLRSDLPDALSSVVWRLISKNPAERFQDAASLKYALDGLLNPTPARLVQQEQPLREAAMQSAIEEEDDYTHTREFASEPAPAARSNKAPLPQLAPVDDGPEKNETVQVERVEPAPASTVAPSREEIDVAQPNATRHERIGREHPAPSIKTFDSAVNPAPVRLALLAAIVIAVVGISVIAYRERLSNRAATAQAQGQPNAAAAGAKEPAPDEPKLNKPEADRPSDDVQPDPGVQESAPAGRSNAVRYSRGARMRARAWASGAGLSAGQPKRSNPRIQRAARRGSGTKGRLWGRYVYKRH